MYDPNTEPVFVQLSKLSTAACKESTFESTVDVAMFAINNYCFKYPRTVMELDMHDSGAFEFYPTSIEKLQRFGAAQYLIENAQQCLNNKMTGLILHFADRNVAHFVMWN